MNFKKNESHPSVHGVCGTSPRYVPPVIHVSSSRPAESYVKFHNSHVTRSKQEAPALQNHVGASTSGHRWESRIPNGPTENLPMCTNTQKSKKSLKNSDQCGHGFQMGASGYRRDDCTSSEYQEDKDTTPLCPNWRLSPQPKGTKVAQDKPERNERYQTPGDNGNPSHLGKPPQGTKHSCPGQSNKPLTGKNLEVNFVDGDMIISQHSTEETLEVKDNKHESYMFLAILVCVFFNFPVAFISLILSIRSQSLFEKGQVRTAQTLAKVSFVISMVALVTGVFLILVAIHFLADLQQKEKL